MIVAVSSSGRAGANSTEILSSVAQFMAATNKVKLYDLPALDFMGCNGCGACRSGSHSCVIEDGLTPVLADIAKADGLVLAAPVYYGYTSGIFKSFLDRWYSFRDGDKRLRLKPNVPLMFILSQGHPDPLAYKGLVESMEKVFCAYGFAPKTFICPAMEAPGLARQRTDVLNKARLMAGELFSGA